MNSSIKLLFIDFSNTLDLSSSGATNLPIPTYSHSKNPTNHHQRSKMSTIYVIDATGTSHRTPFKCGSKDELRFYRVMICSGSILDSQSKLFFEDKKAWDLFSIHRREHAEKRADEDGCFPVRGEWIDGWY